jgi:hypothetical protein
VTTDQERPQKLETIGRYLAGRFPASSVKCGSVDDRLRYWFHIDYPQDPLRRSRRLTIPEEAVDDLDPADIIALLEHPNTERLWSTLGTSPLHLRYDVVTGIELPLRPPPTKPNP